MIMIILIAVLGLVVVNAMKHSPWATSTVFATIPVAILVGFYMRSWRPGRVLEASAIGVALIALSVFGGGWIDQQPALRAMFDYPGASLAGFVIVYGWLAAILPVWLLLAPRDYLSTFLKLGTVFLLAIAILLMHPQIKMPAITQFVDGTGPLFTGKVFPFVFITIACGAGLGISRVGFQRYYAEAHRERARCTADRLRQHGVGIARRHHGDHRGDVARSRCVFCDQRRRGHRGCDA